VSGRAQIFLCLMLSRCAYHSLLHLPVPQAQADHLIRRTSLITWRGMMTKLLTTIYENEGWEMDGMVLDDTLYLQEHVSDDKLEKSRNMDPHHKRQTYFGYDFICRGIRVCVLKRTLSPRYSFESFSTSSIPPSALARGEVDPTIDPKDGWGGDVNTNVQWCSVCKGSLGEFRTLIGGEVDCIMGKLFLIRLVRL
jgi:RAT1-interacting protein